MKKLTWLLVLVLCISLIPTFNPVVKADPSTWYVATTGSDVAAGDIDHPFKTIQKGVDVCVAGDTIYIRGGNYNEIVYMKASGTAGNPITISGFPGEHAVIDGTGVSVPTDYGLISLWSGSGTVGRKNITFQDLTIENSTQMGIRTLDHIANPSSNITIHNCIINNIRHHGLNFNQESTGTLGFITNINVNNCTITNIQTGHDSMGECMTFKGCKNVIFEYNTAVGLHKQGINLCNNTFNVLIDHNRFNNSDCEKISSPFEPSAAMYLDGGQWNLPLVSRVSNVIISNNTIWGCKFGITIVSEFTGGSVDNVTIVNNIINITKDPRGMATHCIFFNYATKHQYDVTIKYNTLYKSDGTATGTGSCINLNLNTGYIHRFIVANNILMSGGTTTYQLVAQISSTNTELIRENNIYNHTSKKENTYFSDGTGKFEATAVRANPQFVSLPAYDFHLNQTSPAIDTPSSTYTTPFDYDGIPRPVFAGYDIGAYEYDGQGSGDSIPPVISQVGVVTSSPFDTLAGYGWENFTCMVTDNVEVSTVLLKFTNPDQSTANVPMIKKTGTTTYYANQSLHQPGNYSYHIQATDTSNNVALSSIHTFSLPTNWDIDNDGIVTILDLVQVSNHYDETGGFGWIREDVDNNGVIEVLDIVIVSSHFGESWWV